VVLASDPRIGSGTDRSVKCRYCDALAGISRSLRF
jgi:hypothetical protein